MPFTVLLCDDTVAERGSKEIGGDLPLHFFTCMSNIMKVTKLWSRIKNLYRRYSHKYLRPHLHIFACLQFAWLRIFESLPQFGDFRDIYKQNSTTVTIIKQNVSMCMPNA